MTSSKQNWLPNFPTISKPSGWLKFLTPIFIGMLIIFLIIHILHFGGPRESLVARAESEIMSYSLLNSATSKAISDRKVIVFSVKDPDLEIMTRAPHESLNDAHILEYASVLEYVSRYNPRWVVVSWLTHAHPLTPEYLAPLLQVIDRLPIRSKISIAINFFAGGSPDLAYAKKFNFIEARDCYHEINLHCTYSPEWTWMPQQIFSRLLNNPQKFISTNLPHHLPNVLLNLPKIESIPSYSFTDAKDPVAGTIDSDSVIFIGNDATQDVMFRDNKEVLQRTLTSQSRLKRNLQQDGIPWHVFWAAMTTMLLEERGVRVADTAFIYGIALSLSFIIFFHAFRKISIWTFITPSFVIILLLLINTFTIHRMNLYLPIMPILITCISSLIIAVFVMGALNHYRKWKLLAIARRADEFADLKQNFLQLVSHNLNTPIAQLKGLLEILTLDAPPNSTLHRALILSDFVRLTSKAALATSAASTRQPNLQRRSLKTVVEDLLDDEGGFFRRMNLRIELGDLQKADTEFNWTRELWMDHETLSNCIVCAAILQATSNKISEIVIRVIATSSVNEGEETLFISLQNSSRRESSNDLDPPPFMLDTISGYLDAVMSTGNIQLRATETETLLTFTYKTPE